MLDLSNPTTHYRKSQEPSKRTIQPKGLRASKRPSAMKLPHHLLASAVCVAVLAATTTAESQAPVRGNDEGHFGPFRGPEAEQNFDPIELYPGPEESEDESELVPPASEEYEGERSLSVAGHDNEDLASEFDQETFEERELAPDVFQEEFPIEGDAQDADADHDLLGYTRHLRSLVDPPRPLEPLALPTLPLDDPEPPAVEPKLPEDTESRRNLRGPQQL